MSVSRAPEAPAVATHWSNIAGIGGWVALAFAYYCFQKAKPVSHKIDRMFGVMRRRDWDLEMLTASVVLSVLAAMVAVIGLGLAYSQFRRRDFTPPYATVVLAVASLACTIFYTLKFR